MGLDDKAIFKGGRRFFRRRDRQLENLAMAADWRSVSRRDRVAWYHGYVRKCMAIRCKGNRKRQKYQQNHFGNHSITRWNRISVS